MMVKEWLKPSEVAELLGISRWTVYRRLLGKKELRAYRVGIQWRIHRDDLRAYLEAHRGERA